MTRKERMIVLANQWKDCRRCGLCETRRSVVFGEGPLNSKVLVVGEAPGKTENLFGRPFVGDSGRALRTALAATQELLGSFRFFVTNVVGCRPCDAANGPNRAPVPEELEACSSRLVELIDILNPKVIVSAGRISERQLKKLKIASSYIEHPASFLRRGGFSGPHGNAYIQTLLDTLQKGGIQ